MHEQRAPALLPVAPCRSPHPTLTRRAHNIFVPGCPCHLFRAGRTVALRDAGLRCEMVRFIDPLVTPENTLLLAWAPALGLGGGWEDRFDNALALHRA